MLIPVEALTAEVVIVNGAVVLPAPIVTLAGTLATAGFALDKLTTTPPVDAGWVRVTVPVDGLVPMMEVGLNVTVETLVAGRIVRDTRVFEPPNDAVIDTVVEVVTAAVEIVNVAVVAPPFTSTLAGTVATAVLLLLSATVAPPVGAGPLSVTVPVDSPPPTREAGFAARVEGTGGFTVSVAAKLFP